MPTPIYAPMLQPGDHIGLAFPSQPLDPVKLDRYRFVLQGLGYKVKLGPLSGEILGRSSTVVSSERLGVSRDSLGQLGAQGQSDLDQPVALGHRACGNPSLAPATGQTLSPEEPIQAQGVDRLPSSGEPVLPSAADRAADFNALLADDQVKLILFGGGDGAVELLPLIDYGAIARSPKLISSFSDASSLLMAIAAQTGLVTYYGLGLGAFTALSHYNWRQFQQHFVAGPAGGPFLVDSPWRSLSAGAASGRLLACYAGLLPAMLHHPLWEDSGWGRDPGQPLILALEDHEFFSSPGQVGTWLSFLEQQPFIEAVQGLIFGHFADSAPHELLERLARFGADHHIPVVYCDDFGHGDRHAIWPIGATVTLDGNQASVEFLG
ncbi:MAG: LD-carboxypeptidase [Propionibacteriaceae bacterium]|jgi:muramoyltetrapeptide carboxypeptidase|nr:LD-carboxypeptidase [Propionibacteriaceae bacterium]